jgi:type I restriction enzyme S subunit
MKPGYKQTEVGVIPEDWEVKTLGSLTTLLTNGFVGTATTAYINGDDGVLYIQGYNVQENGFNFHGIKRVSKAFHTRNKKSCLQAGDLLTIQTGDIGVTTVVPPELVGANCHALIISRLRKQESEPGYYCQYFNSERGRVAFKEIETGTTMKHLNGGDMKRLFLPSPPLPEQCAIAEALSDVDGLLGGLDRLIAKKRDLKQAAMQQLLTGQTRLPGFHGEWEVKRLKQVAEISTGINKPLSEMGSGALYVTVQDLYDKSSIRTERLSRIKVSPSEIETRCLAVGDVVFGKSSVKRDGIGYPSQFLGCDEPVVFSGFTYRARAKRGIADATFLFYALRAERTRRWLIDNSQASALTNINQSIADAIPVQVPPSISEQTAIAQILSDMDAELTALEQRREKTRALKQAMMQELLTGRTRLV